MAETSSKRNLSAAVKHSRKTHLDISWELVPISLSVFESIMIYIFELSVECSG